jgi:hypothetical protein
MNIREEATSTSEFAAPLAAGTYLVGDPCYAFSNDAPGDLWGEWLGDAWKDVDANRVKILDGRVQGMRIAASNTAYGDGVYRDQNSFEYMVDAGLLGAVHIGFIANLYPEYAGLTHEEIAEKCSMRLVEFPRPFHVSFDADDGTVTIGHISIMTGDDIDEDWEEAWEEDEEVDEDDVLS